MTAPWIRDRLDAVRKELDLDPMEPVEEGLVRVVDAQHRIIKDLAARLEKLENKVQGIQDQNGLWDGS